MARAEQKVNDLLAEDSDMDDALSTVLSLANSNGGTVEWADVKDDLTSGQWGRLIEKGILRSANSGGFSVQNPEKVRAALNGDSGSEHATDESDSDDDEGSSWTTYDKMAGLAALAFMPAYFYGPMREAVAKTMNIAIGPIDAIMPFYAVVIILSVLTGLYSTLLQGKMVDHSEMNDVSDEMNDIKERQKAAKERGDDEAVQRLQKEQMSVMSDQFGAMKGTFRPMVWITLLTIPVFVWLIWMVGRGGAGHLGNDLNVIFPLVGQVKWTDGIVGPMQAWIVWYFLCSVGFRQLIQKSLNIQTTPSTS